jgi:roadblock/LC7 domain-containing protein
MTLEQHQTVEATESQAHYSPEEAGEILRIAAHLQDNKITAEQLRAIAREAGVSDENLERAIQQFEESRRVETRRKQQIAARRKFWLKTLAWALALVAIMSAGLLGILSLSVSAVKTLTHHAQTRYILDSSNGCVVYRTPGDNDIIIRRADGTELVVPHFQAVLDASISPSGAHVALYDDITKEVWVVNVNSGAFKKAVPTGQASASGMTHGYELHRYPLAGWRPAEGRDVLRIRLKDGRVVEIDDFPVR